MMKVADGDMTIEVPYLDRGDEIGDLAKALATFKQHACEKMRIEEEERARQSRAATRQQAIEKHIAAFEHQIGEALKTLTSASGDMRTTSEKLATTANETDGQARNAAVGVGGNVDQCADGGERLGGTRLVDP